jgi:transcriptional regulator with XRE-family HTH domain
MERQWVVRSPEGLGQAVAEIRRARGMTQAELAAGDGLRRDWLAKLESGRTNRVLEHLLRLLRRLGATVTVTWDDERPPAPGRDG